ncbi:MBL fold metallo-hydrolase [Haladaptatus sp. DJG-WS-42]|uniref:MBL fold metallo-hydrolase n=1 Tax=Haladaptatus sp. DJG-WS-42 TaxID=3120516 RepID=UPI0030D54634
MTVPAVHRIEFPVDWEPGHVAAYLVDGPETVLFDAGTPGEDAREILRDGLGAVGFAPADIDHLVITHPHVDHIGQVETVLDAGSPRLYAPASVEQRFARDEADLAAVVETNAQAAGVEDVAAAVEMSVRSLTRNRRLLPPADVSRWVEPGETVSIGGFDYTAVHAGGHQADHLCYAADFDETRTLFSGDMAIEPFRSVGLHVGLDNGVGETIPTFYEGIDRLGTLDIDRVYPGHGPVHESFHESIAQSRASLDNLCEWVTTLLDSGIETGAAVATERARTDRERSSLLPESYGMVLWLEQQGVVTSTIVDGVRRFRLAP